ncbi:hypothetical protein [Vibrio agarivorans]|uniref:Uncharacterized protein n=1 Tax=Vibrio agarivorans TaxID=153622 RepID=A0ABT7Y3Z1_9VIBR|nr:hypothetical protein [Vibrio agarivorans]MDN2482701.1 hypothetical protein [Vibrio agarivorans]
MKYSTSLLVLAALTSSCTLAAPKAQSDDSQKEAVNQPFVISGDDIQALSDTHWRIKVSYQEAVKVRCVAFTEDEEAVAIDSVAVIPPYEVSNMYTREDDGDIAEVKCWITSTRAEDLGNDYIRHTLD